MMLVSMKETKIRKIYQSNAAKLSKTLQIKSLHKESEAYIIQGQRIRCTASVGLALKPRHGNDLWDLVSFADRAMYSAKGARAQEAANDRLAVDEATDAS